MKLKSKKNIKTIILDLGGVIIPINPELSFKSFAQKSGWELETVKTFFKKNLIFKTYENGDITTDEFLQLISHHLVLSNDEIIDSWNKLLLEIPRSRIEFLSELRKNHQLLLISNTNELHINAINQQLQQRELPSLSQIFDKLYYSFEIKLSKPSKEIYEHVLKDLELKPDETVFIDDLKENVEGAEYAGINGLHLNLSIHQLENLFDNE
ncbi:MAG: HAD family phosphatase [Cytophagales bacterium]